MGIQIDINQAAEWVTVGDASVNIELLVQPMTHLAKMKALGLVRSDLAASEKYSLAETVKGWRGVDDVNGQPIKFSVEGLSKLMGLLPALGEAIDQAVMAVNGRNLDKRVTCPECGCTFDGSAHSAKGSITNADALADPTTKTAATG